MHHSIIKVIALLWSFAFLSPQVSRHDDCSKPCDAVTGRTQDARGLIDALLPGCAGTLPRRGLLLLSLTGVNVVVAAVISRLVCHIVRELAERVPEAPVRLRETRLSSPFSRICPGADARLEK